MKRCQKSILTVIAIEGNKMQKIRCKNGKCWDESSSKKKIESVCKKDDIVCETEAEIIGSQIDDDIDGNDEELL